MASPSRPGIYKASTPGELFSGFFNVAHHKAHRPQSSCQSRYSLPMLNSTSAVARTTLPSTPQLPRRRGGLVDIELCIWLEVIRDITNKREAWWRSWWEARRDGPSRCPRPAAIWYGRRLTFVIHYVMHCPNLTTAFQRRQAKLSCRPSTTILERLACLDVREPSLLILGTRKTTMQDINRLWTI